MPVAKCIEAPQLHHMHGGNCDDEQILRLGTAELIAYCNLGLYQESYS